MIDLLKHFGIKTRFIRGDTKSYNMSATASECDICQTPITDWHVDGKTKMGPWADMCPGCYKTYGVGLGVGKGQKYRGGKKIEG